MKRALFALVPLLLLLLGGEWLARRHEASLPVRPPGMMVPHPTRIWALYPGEHRLAGVASHINPLGLRAVPDDPAPLRILTIGDSSIFGHGLNDPDTLHAQLDAALAARGVDVAVHCGGVPGYSTEQSLVLLDEVGWDLNPNLLVVGNLWSDFQTEHFTDRLWIQTLNSPKQRLERLLSKSAAWRQLRLRLAGPEATSAGGLPVSWVRDPLADVHSRVSAEEYQENLNTLADQAKERGVGLAFIAPCHSVDLKNYPVPWGAYFQIQRELAERIGAPLVNTCSLYRSAGLTLNEAFLDDLHPTGRGNAVVAEGLAQALVDAGWPSRPLTPP